MGKIVPETIKKFDGGMQTDTRRVSPTGGRLIKNFDILSFPSKLKPYNSSESGNDTAARAFSTFLYGNSKLYGLGVVSATTKPKIFSKDTFTDGTWTEPGNGEGTSARNTNFFTYYKSAIYGAQGGTAFWKFLISGAGFTDSDLAVTYTNVSNGIVHSKDDILYVGYDNIIAKNNAGSWTLAALTLPSDYYITSICEYGNYLAIACAPASSAGRTVSRVFLWDRDSSLTTLSESIDWGEGSLNVLEEYDGGLLGISILGNRLMIKYWASAFLKIGERKHLEFLLDANVAPTLSQQKQKANDRIYFLLGARIDGTGANNQFGVFSIGKNSDGVFALSLDRTPNNDTDPNSLVGFYLATVSGVDYMFISYNDGSGNVQTSKTSESDTTFSHTSTFKTQIFDSGVVRFPKKLVRVIVDTEPLPTAGSYTVSYRKDEETAYTTIFTHSTDNSLSHTAINIESTGATLPQYNEIQFQITATGGATITGFSFEAEITDKAI